MTGFNRSDRGDSGFTLIEIMIALAIIGTTVTVILNTVNYHTGIMYDNTVTTRMYQLAKEKMSTMERKPVNSKGTFKTDKNYSFENTVSGMPGTELLQLKTVVRGDGREVELNRLMIRRSGN